MPDKIVFNSIQSSPGTKIGPCTGKKFLVTGGSRGLGKAIVAELYEQGAIIYALARNTENLAALKEQFPTVTTICADLADWDGTRKALENLEPVDCLINNAAVCPSSSFWNLTKEIYDKIYETNLRSILNVSQVVAKKMVENGKGGAIVNVSSFLAYSVMTPVLGYGTMKAALEMLTKGMAIELAPHKITCNSVCPAALATDMVFEKKEGQDDIDVDAVLKYMEKKTPTNVGFMPLEDVVNAILFLGSGVTSQITGESLKIDGGISIAF